MLRRNIKGAAVMRAFVASLRAAAESIGGPLYVQETASGYDVLDRETGETVADAPTLKAALSALLTHASYSDAVKPAVLRGEDSAPAGVWRWLDASAVEDAPAHDGSQVTAEAIRTMIDRLNASRQPIMIDGGSDDSGAHASVGATDTRANGFAHVAAEWVEADGRSHLALYAELVPEIAPDVDSGRLAFGSIAFAQDPANLADAALWSHALTNLPAIEGLTPSSALRTQLGPRLFARSRPIRSLPMPPKKTAPVAATAKLRAAGYDLKAISEAIASLPKDATCEQICSACEASCKMQEAQDPSIVAPADVAEPKAADVVAPKDAAAAGDAPVAKADEPVADVAAPRAPDAPEALQAFGAEVVPMLAEALGVEPTAAAVLDALKANLDKLKGAASVPANGTAADQNAGVTPMDAASKDAKIIGLETAVRTLTERVGSTEKTLGEREAAIAKRELGDSIVARFATAKLTLATDKIGELVDLALSVPVEKREAILDMALRSANVPPSGRAVGQAGAASVRGEVGGADPDAALEAAQAAVDAEHPEWTRTQRAAETYKRSRAAFVAAEKN